jgi:hypothetical protein
MCFKPAGRSAASLSDVCSDPKVKAQKADRCKKKHDKQKKKEEAKKERSRQRCKLETFLFVQSCRGNCFTKNESKEEEKVFFY